MKKDKLLNSSLSSATSSISESHPSSPSESHPSSPAESHSLSPSDNHSLYDPSVLKDEFLLPYLPDIAMRNGYIREKTGLITDHGAVPLYDVADYHLFFGLHPLHGDHPFLSATATASLSATGTSSPEPSVPSKGKGWIFREWAPNATSVYIIGTMTDWKIDERFSLFKRESEAKIETLASGGSEQDGALPGDGYPVNGIWERFFPEEAFSHGDLYRLKIFWNGKEDQKRGGDRIPTCATRVVQDPQTLIFNAQVWNPEAQYVWQNRCGWNGSGQYNSLTPEVHLSASDSQEPLLIYEAHTGMAQEEGRVGTFLEFKEHILPRIKESGYNAIQLMAVQEHPYYGSFGYHVSNFFAPSSRFGTPDEFRSLVDAAHGVGIKVIIDIVHSHAVSNEVEGLSRFDGSLTQFFHDGERGFHSLWGSRCFDYSKSMVVRFLLSNCRYWIEEFHVDGFRFDGITSMLYKDHGIGRSFTSYADYFEDGQKTSSLKSNRDLNNSGNVDLDALCYLYLANRLIHSMVPDAITIAEDVSGYPGLAAPQWRGGTGFDYRFAMGVADFWIKVLKEYRDEKWPLGKLWYELNARRDDEKSISYAECHDQALVGDQTLMMRLMGEDIYSAMSIDSETGRTFRGVALHKMVRLITLATAGSGYLNFMGNEFGHPEWIDFPGAHNHWSYHFARRQWSLRDNDQLYFYMLAKFDKDMVALAKSFPFLGLDRAELLHVHEDNKVIAFKRRIGSIEDRENDNTNLIFIFNFNPQRSFQDYMVDAPPGKYLEVMNSDEIAYGGKGRLAAGQEHFTHHDALLSRNTLSLYLPARSAVVLASV